MKKIHPLILCGGSGTRLWPISRTRSPKQFQKIGGKDSVSFFQAAIQRHSGEGFHDPCIVTSLRHRATVVHQLKEIQSGSRIICEPMARNTGPAVLAAALTLMASDPEALILVVPADHVIEGDINSTIMRYAGAAMDGNIITFGISPRGPESGFGYITKGEEIDGFSGLYKVDQFIEKPSKPEAQRIIDELDAAWASGISLFSAKTIVEEYEKYDPGTAAAIKRSVMGAAIFPEAFYLDGEAFSEAKADPTEMAVFERTDRIVTTSLEVNWNDVGSWSAMFDIAKSDSNGNVFQGDVVAVSSKNTMVRSEGRLVSVVGLDDIIVVDTPDALLVTRRTSTQKVKDVVEELKSKARPEAEYYASAAPKMVSFTMPAGLERIHETETFNLGTSQLPLGAFVDMDAGHGRQVIVVKGTVHAQGPAWQKTVREGGRIYSDPEGSIRITNCGDGEGELLFMTFDTDVDSPKSLPASASHA